MENICAQEELPEFLSKLITPFLKDLNQETQFLVNFTPGEPAEVILVTPADEDEEVTMSDAVFVHVLDYSFYNYGCTIDKKFHQPIFDVLGGRIERGQRRDIVLRYDGKDFAAQIENVDRKGVQSDTIRCMWKGKAASKLSTYLQQQFADAFSQIKGLHESHVNVLPSNLKRIALFYNKEAKVFEMELQ